MSFEPSSAAVWALKQALESKIDKKAASESSIFVATVSKVDKEGQVFVNAGREGDSIVNGQVVTALSENDKVLVSQERGVISVLGNVDHVATDDQAAIASMQKAVEVEVLANSALEDAFNAKLAAIEANEAADDAKVSASEARVSASSASRYAYTALSNLSDIEKVVDAITWIANHGEYVPSSDESVLADKLYYKVTSGEGTEDNPYVYEPVENPRDADIYYMDYQLTDDTIVDPEATYYVCHNEYHPTTDPVVLPGKTYYTYVISHYTLTDDTEIDHDKMYYWHHQEYQKTQDVEVEFGKVYYISTIVEYHSCAGEEFNDGLIYYELADGEYVQVENPVAEDVDSYFLPVEGYAIVDDPVDEDIDDYYEFVDEYVVVDKPNPDLLPLYFEAVWTYQPVIAPTSDNLDAYYEEEEVYSRVESPTTEDISNYYEYTRVPNYYELNVNESVSNYINKHVVLMNDGLHIIGRDDTYGTEVDYQGVFTPTGVDFLNPEGYSTSHYGEVTRIGLAEALHLMLTNSMLGFYNGAERLAYFGLDENQVWNLMIENAYVKQQMRFGDYAFSNRSNGNMTLRYVGEDD